VSSPLTILHILEKNRLVTGSVVQMMDAVGALAARGHRVTVAGRSGGDLERACSHCGVAFLPVPLRGALDLRSIGSLRRHLRGVPTDVIHVHKGRAHALALLASTGLGRLPRVVVNRGVTFPLDRANRIKYLHPRVAAVVCVADAVRELVIYSGRLPPERVHTVRGGTDPDRFDPDLADRAAVRHELGLSGDQPLIGQVSLRDWKGWRELVAAFASLHLTVADARLLLVGYDTDDDRCKVLDATRTLGVADVVLTTPYRTDMADVLAACDVVVDASWAGTGITGTVREAMALERAVVASDCGGNRELVVHGEVGLVVPPRDTTALADALVRLLVDPELRRRLGRAARRRVIEGFTTEQRIERLEAVYRKTVGE
jgi:glycosyltransferase involved in cell wall biosynthesis